MKKEIGFMKTRFIDLAKDKTLYTIDEYIDLGNIEEEINNRKDLQEALKKSKSYCGIIATDKRTLKDIIGIVEYRDVNDYEDCDFIEQSYFYVDSAEWNDKCWITDTLKRMNYGIIEYCNRYMRLIK